MKTPIITRFCTGLAALALIVTFALASSTARAQTKDSEDISKYLSEAKTHAVLAEDDAATLDAYANSNISWESHAARLENMREHVNNLGKTVKELTDLRAEGSPWQQEAIDRINPLLRSMADQLSATINHLSNNKERIHMQAYRDYVRANSELASRTASVIKDLVDYGKAKSRAESLETKLELPASK